MGIFKLELGKNNKNKAKLVITAVLIIILILAAPGAFRAQRKRKANQNAIFSSGRPVTRDEFGISHFQKLLEETRNLKVERDPFSRGQAHSSSAKDISMLGLSGIIWDKKNPKAIISGKIVGIGSKVKNNLVVEIKPNSVILNDGEKDFEIILKK
jgi:hypothetical protein